MRHPPAHAASVAAAPPECVHGGAADGRGGGGCGDGGGGVNGSGGENGGAHRLSSCNRAGLLALAAPLGCSCRLPLRPRRRRSRCWCRPPYRERRNPADDEGVLGRDGCEEGGSSRGGYEMSGAAGMGKGRGAPTRPSQSSLRRRAAMPLARPSWYVSSTTSSLVLSHLCSNVAVLLARAPAERGRGSAVRWARGVRVEVQVVALQRVLLRGVLLEVGLASSSMSMDSTGTQSVGAREYDAWRSGEGTRCRRSNRSAQQVEGICGCPIVHVDRKVGPKAVITPSFLVNDVPIVHPCGWMQCSPNGF